MEAATTNSVLNTKVICSHCGYAHGDNSVSGVVVCPRCNTPKAFVAIKDIPMNPDISQDILDDIFSLT